MHNRPMEIKRFSESRLFINNGEDSFRLFKLTQINDGSIIFSSPDLSSTVIHTLSKESSNLPRLLSLNNMDNGHISFHGSGEVHVKKSNEYLLPNVGQHLFKPLENDISVRHLFTAAFKQPDNPDTEAGRRQSDAIIQAEPSKPFAMLVFAVPGTVNQLGLESSFHIDDLDDIPGVLGVGHLPFRYHNIVWIAYRTKHMEVWPRASSILYHDGIVIPLIMKQVDNTIAIDFRIPEYKLDGSSLSLNFAKQF